MTHSDFMPQLINNEGKVVRIEFGYRAVEVEQPSMDGSETQTRTEYQGHTVRVEQPLEYGKVVSAIVRLKYSADEVEAILCNGSDTPTHEEELRIFQAWRTQAKEVAREVCGIQQ